MNNVTGLDANTSYSPSQKKKKKPSAEQSALSDADKQIMKAMGLLANVLRSARREAGEATIDPTRKAELEAWIEQHAAEIDARIEVSKHTPSESRRSRTSKRHIGKAIASLREVLTGRAEARSICRSWSRSGEGCGAQ
jgi:hypothetical protein